MMAALAQAAPASDLLDIFSAYDGGVLFRGLTEGVGGQPSVLGRIGWIFTGFGAVFVLWGFVMRARGTSGEGRMGEVARTWIVLALMVGGPFLVRTAMEGADGLYASSVGGPSALTATCVKAAYAMPELNVLFDVLRRSAAERAGPAPAQAQRQALIDHANDGSVLGYVEALGVAVWDTAADDAAGAAQTWSGMVRMVSLATGLGSALLKCLLIAATVVPLYFLLLASAAVVWFMQQLRFFLAVSGTAMLPLFTGMFSLPAGHPNRQSAQAYVMHLLSVALWPVAWVVGHTGTVALYNALVSLIAGTSRVPDMVALLQWDGLAASAPTAAQLRAADTALGNWFMGNVTALLSILVGGVGFAFWVFSVSILGPVFLHRLLTAGALFFSQAAQSAGLQAMGAGRLAAGAAQAAGLGVPYPGAAAGERLASAAAVEAHGAGAGVWGATHAGDGSSMQGAAERVDDSDGNGGERV